MSLQISAIQLVMKQVVLVRAMVRNVLFPNNMTVSPTMYFNVTQRQQQNLSAPVDCIYVTRSECTDGWFADFAIEYGKTYHVYLAIVVCCFGTIANMLNIAVLTRKDMASAPINRILTGIAVADMMIMVEYIPFGYYYYVILPGKMNFPYWGAVYMLAHMHFAQIMHTTSICLTLTLAIWRYLAIG